jgi:hypothetical protein
MAAANAAFSADVGSPIGIKGSAKTRARVMSPAVGDGENTGKLGGAMTVGTVRFTVTGGAESLGVGVVTVGSWGCVVSVCGAATAGIGASTCVITRNAAI